MRFARRAGLIWLLVASLSVSVALPGRAGAPTPEPMPSAVATQTKDRVAGRPVPGRYIVTLRPNSFSSQAVSDLRRRLNLRIDLEFDRALRGFAGKLTPAQVKDLRADPRVLRVEPDVWRQAHNAPVPTGVDRIGADSTANGVSAARAGDPVAVLDTGVANHSDLNRRGGYNCTNSNRSAYGDADGHGTHVAGTIGASGGIAGVAPGTPIFAVKVLGDDGYGWDSWIVCGLNWVAEHHHELGIVAVNMSLGGPDYDNESSTNCGSSSLHQAICNLRQEGVRIVVSAGNDNQNAGNQVPAKFSQVITVAAMTDTDGCAGGRGGTSSWGRRDRDDRKWIWSNFGEVVDVIAPGVDIRSTVPGGYARYSGTSMAAPHVTGAIAAGWDPATGPRERGIPGFHSELGLVELSAHVSCRGAGSVNPTIKLQPKTAQPGERVTVRLQGYRAGDRVRILLDGRKGDVVRIRQDGSGTGRVWVPRSADAGRHLVRGIGGNGGSDSARLRVRD